MQTSLRMTLFRNSLACVAGGIVRVRRKVLTVESEYGRRSREENGKEPFEMASPLASRGLAARIGGSAAIASRWPRTRDNIPPATQARNSLTYSILN